MRKRLECTLLEDTGEIHLEDQLCSPEKAILCNEEKEIIKQVISHLQPEHKQVPLDLYYSCFYYDGGKINLDHFIAKNYFYKYFLKWDPEAVSLRLNINAIHSCSVKYYDIQYIVCQAP
ncbi:MAG: hypothetical protein ACUVTU_09075 [Desulfurispora sp.]|uniref:hypothetical protein n=1 Tax=Desulfurispora sp. TaxID=3014275 RepID=UPI00404A1B01